MNKTLHSNLLGLIGSIVVLCVSLVGFYWLWSSAQPKDLSTISIDQKYQKIEIESIKQDAQELMKDKANLSTMPIQSPASDTLGRTNPFAGL